MGVWGCVGGGAIREVQHNLLCYKEHKDVIHVYLSFAVGRHMYRSVPIVTIDYLQVDDTEVSTIVVTVMHCQVLLTLSAITYYDRISEIMTIYGYYLLIN